MSQNNLIHLAYIMDGNGRWATKQDKPRNYGHLMGAKVIPKLIDMAIVEKIKYLSLFAFSVENWNRPEIEVNYLINLLLKYATKKTINYLNKKDIRINWIGFEDKLNKSILDKISLITKATTNNKTIEVNIFFNYSGVKDIEQAFASFIKNNDQNKFNKLNVKEFLLTKNLPPIDLLVRTGNEKRISNFALYDIAYSEIIFEKTLWPDYSKLNFDSNIKEYYNRNRRFGKINEH